MILQSVFSTKQCATGDQGTESLSSLHHEDLAIPVSVLDSYLFAKFPGNQCCHNQRDGPVGEQRKTFLSLCDRDPSTWLLFLSPHPRRRSGFSINPLRDPVSSSYLLCCKDTSPRPLIKSTEVSTGQSHQESDVYATGTETSVSFRHALSRPVNREQGRQASCLIHLLSLLLAP